MLLVEGVTEGKKVAFRQNSSKVMISSVVSEVRPVKEVSSRRCCRATWMARLVGTLVKRETIFNFNSFLSSPHIISCHPHTFNTCTLCKPLPLMKAAASCRNVWYFKENLWLVISAKEP